MRKSIIVLIFIIVIFTGCLSLPENPTESKELNNNLANEEELDSKNTPENKSRQNNSTKTQIYVDKTTTRIKIVFTIENEIISEDDYEVINPNGELVVEFTNGLQLSERKQIIVGDTDKLRG